LVLVERIFKTEAKAFETLEFIPNWKEESMKYGAQNKFEDPCSKLQGIFDRKECGLF
jgi:hypothetical protein